MALSQVLRSACRVSALAQLSATRSLTSSALKRTVAPQSSLRNLLSAEFKRTISTTPVKNSSAGGSHAALWTIERGVSLGLLAVIPGAFLFPCQALDALMAVSVVMHQHWGLEAMVTDYVRPVIFGNVVPKAAHAALFLFSVATLGGLFYLIYNDIGIAKSVKKIWAIKGQ